LIAGGPISRIIVTHSPERRTLTVMLSSERPTDTASKPIFRAITSIHSRVRVAVFPARNINSPNHINSRTASSAAAMDALSFLSRYEVTFGCEVDEVTELISPWVVQGRDVILAK